MASTASADDAKLITDVNSVKTSVETAKALEAALTENFICELYLFVPKQLKSRA
jgi:hypothetical protein